MSQFEKSEIWLDYAKTVYPGSGMKKEAVSPKLLAGPGVRSLVTSLGVDLAFPASSGVWALLKGVGLRGALAAMLPTGPIGWGIAAVIATTSVAIAITTAVNDVTGNIDVLLKRMEELDYEDTDASTTIVEWKEFLDKRKNYIKSVTLAGANNDEEKAKTMAIAQVQLVEILKYLKTMKEEYPTLVKPYLEDWEFLVWNEPKDFEDTLNNVITNAEKRLAEIKKQSVAAGKKIIESLKDPDLVMEEIYSLDTQITNAWGKPIYTAEEDAAIEIGKKIKTRKISANEYYENHPKLVSIKEDLKKLLNQVKKKTNRAQKDISLLKSAVSLPEKPTAPGKQVEQGKQISKRPSIPKNDVVETLQIYLNHLKTALGIPSENVTEDGRYGPKTAKALEKTLIKLNEMNEEILKDFRYRGGIQLERINEIQYMNSNPGIINYITKELGGVVESVKKYRERGVYEFGKQKQQQQQPGQTQPGQPIDGRSDIGSKQNPTRDEMLAYFKTLHDTIGGGRVNLYDYAQQNLGMSDNDIFNLLYNKYPGWAPKDWSISNIIEAMGNRSSIFY